MPTLSVIGFEGLPSLENAGNVIYKELKLRASMRLPPTLNAEKANELLKEKFLEQKEDTFGALVEYSTVDKANGFDSPKLPENISNIFNEAHKVSNKILLICN